MKKLWLPALFLLLAGCASTDRMVRMSGGVFDEYSAPKSTRIRSEKYQKISQSFSSSRRSNKVELAGMDDTLVNIWPFFFRSNNYWTALWPMVDKDPYGFAFRPFYNHEGDDYSILFPLSAWNTAGKHGWVALFRWKSNGFGFIPLTWQWKEGLRGGAYYTPLFIYSYDGNQPEYKLNEKDIFQRWSVNELFWTVCGVIYDRTVYVKRGKWSWLFGLREGAAENKNIWNYHFNGQKPYPANHNELNRFRQQIFAELPRVTEKVYGFLPLWVGGFCDDGDYFNRFLLIAGNHKNGKNYSFDILGKVLGEYEVKDKSIFSGSEEKVERFTSWVLMSNFRTDYWYEKTAAWQHFQKLQGLIYPSGSFTKNRPAIEDTLKKLDPSLKLPATVVDSATFELFVRDLRSKYQFPTYKEYTGLVLPLFYYNIDKDKSNSFIVPLLTWWDKSANHYRFNSLPLLTFIRRSQYEDYTVVFSPLAYYAKEYHRDRENYPVFNRNDQRVPEYDCAELRDQYAGLGLFYRGRFGFNVAKRGVDAPAVESLRKKLISLPFEKNNLENFRKRIAEQTSLNDRWQTKGEIERLKKLIRYEELKLDRRKLAEKEKELDKNIAEALGFAGKIGFKIDKDTLCDREKADAARKELVGKFSELRFYEDIGNGFFFRKEKNSNGDHNWHFCHILAGGEKKGDRESTHILHLLYRYRKEANKSETIIFPFISSVQDGEDSRVSFLWRVFSLSKRNGKTGGHIFFIPFGSEW